MKKLTTFLLFIFTLCALFARPQDPRIVREKGAKDGASYEFEVYVAKTRERYKDALITTTTIYPTPDGGARAVSSTTRGKVKRKKPETIIEEIPVCGYYEYKGKEYAGILMSVVWQGKIVEEFPFLIKPEDLAAFNKQMAYSCSENASGVSGRALRVVCVKIPGVKFEGNDVSAFLITRW